MKNSSLRNAVVPLFFSFLVFLVLQAIAEPRGVTPRNSIKGAQPKGEGAFPGGTTGSGVHVKGGHVDGGSRGDGFCTQVPVAKAYKCVKEEQVERSYNCDNNVEREVCEYVEQELKEDCYRLRKEIVPFPCFRVKKEEVCWKVPQQKSKKCKKVVKRQKEIENERTVRREVCQQKVLQVPSLCYRTEEQTMAYMCYRKSKPICKKERVTEKRTCKEKVQKTEPYKCEKTVFETRCNSSGSTENYNESRRNNYFYYNGKRPEPVCHDVAVTKPDTCYRTTEVEVEKPCDETKIQTICKTADPIPETCEKKIPTLREFSCTSARHEEECPLVEVVEKTVDYVYEEDEETFDCPYIEEKEKCLRYEAVVSDICEQEVQKVEKYVCPKTWNKEICHVKNIVTPHTCYRVESTEREHTCYDVEYQKVCLGNSGTSGLGSDGGKGLPPVPKK